MEEAQYTFPLALPLVVLRVLHAGLKACLRLHTYGIAQTEKGALDYAVATCYGEGLLRDST